MKRSPAADGRPARGGPDRQNSDPHRNHDGPSPVPAPALPAPTVPPRHLSPTWVSPTWGPDGPARPSWNHSLEASESGRALRHADRPLSFRTCRSPSCRPRSSANRTCPTAPSRRPITCRATTPDRSSTPPSRRQPAAARPDGIREVRPESPNLAKNGVACRAGRSTPARVLADRRRKWPGSPPCSSTHRGGLSRFVADRDGPAFRSRRIR